MVGDRLDDSGGAGVFHYIGYSKLDCVDGRFGLLRQVDQPPDCHHLCSCVQHPVDFRVAVQRVETRVGLLRGDEFDPVDGQNVFGHAEHRYRQREFHGVARNHFHHDQNHQVHEHDALGIDSRVYLGV
eukprot:CAMPEP_0116973594 /NCGR_PEP_ID=MMETSP0467-20121206/54597_1 /TAXON_ID=283647 /ORGANISM="Mesodinium pulex, Strain SPMC105" /LENGTH=127 /DNA_ID=CAMNT_0004665439 /DNA_START=510 /DNA_END=892 /DNA_ORIENTATION=-